MKLRSTLSALMLTAGVAAAPAANAALIFSLQQVGSDVVGTASGSVDITGFAVLPIFDNRFPEVDPSISTIYFAPARANTGYRFYSGLVPPSPTLGPGFSVVPNSASGSAVGVNYDFLALPLGYVSGAPLSSTMTFNAKTLASMGLVEGVYTWTWGSGANADSLTLTIGAPPPPVSAVPVPASLLLLATGVAALGAARRRLSA